MSSVDEIETTKQTVARLERSRYAAMVEADVGKLGELFADELVYAHSSGGHDSKASLLAKIESGHLDYTTADNPQLDVVVLGETAIVTGRMVSELRVGGEARRIDNPNLAVWARHGGRWQFLAYQPSAAASA